MSGPLVDDVVAWLATQALDDTIVDRPQSTIVPPRIASTTAGRRALEMIAQLTPASKPGAIELGELLGEGGMGRVHLATQVAVGRDVAVKSLKPEVRSDSATMELLREAWVTGALEHPNVIPVYDIEVDGEGNPLIVLKKIEGETWTDLIARESLEWNIGIFSQVLNATRYAHSRGIIHRDLKPDNVMIGRFGEVYVVDWGIAVSLRDDGTGRLPLAANQTQMAGTPAYMAPEMLGGDPGQLSERTDIYLLGAILYEIVTGRPPHTGKTAIEIVTNVVSSEPEFPADDTPPAIERICRTAMQKKPSDRFQSVEHMQEAVDEVVRHRDSARLAWRAERKRGQLEALLAEDTPPGQESERRQRAYNLYGQCRFGFREALASWPDNPDANDGLHGAVRAMAEYELAHGGARAASALLADVDEPPEQLARRVKQAMADEVRRAAELESLRADHDPSTGQNTRLVFAVIGLLLWAVAPVVLAIVREHGPSRIEMLASSGAVLVVFCAMGMWAWDSVRATKFNRSLFFSVVVALVAGGAMQLGAFQLGLNAHASACLHIILWGSIAGVFAATFERAFAFAAVSYFVAYFVATRWPGSVMYVIGVANSTVPITAIILWRKPLESTRE